MSIVSPYDSPGAEVRRVWSLGWPVSLGMAGLVIMGAVDTVMVGALGTEPLASLAIGNMWAFGLAILGHSAARGLDPIVSQAFGAGDREAAGQALVRGLILAVLVAVPLMALHQWTAEGLGVLGQPTHLLDDAEAYALARMWGLPFAFCFDATRQFLQGLGIMRPATVVVLVANVLNAALNAWFIYGGLGVEPMGVVGCGWATSASMLFIFVGLVALTWGVLREWWPGLRGVWSPLPMIRLVRFAVPAAVQSGLEVWAFISAGLMMGWMGAVELDAHVIALNLASLSFMLPYGLSAASATRVGNLIGAGHRWQASAWTALALGAGIVSVVACFFVAVPEPLVAIYTREPEVIALGAVLLPIAGAFQVFDGSQAVAFGVLRGAGDFAVPTVINVFGFYAFGLPIGYWLAFHAGWGPTGVWTGLTLGLAAVAVLLVGRVRWLAGRGVAAVVVADRAVGE